MQRVGNLSRRGVACGKSDQQRPSSFRCPRTTTIPVSILKCQRIQSLSMQVQWWEGYNQSTMQKWRWVRLVVRCEMSGREVSGGKMRL